MECNPQNTTAIILAAGSSGRMGIPKALLKLPDGVTFMEHAVNVFFECGIEKVIVVVHPTVFKVLEYRKPWFFSDVQFVVNHEQERGRIFSIRLGLENIQDSQFAFIHNVDQPFLTSDLIVKMQKRVENGSFVVPAYEGNSGHPVLMDGVVIASVLKNYANCQNLRTLLEPFYKNVVHTQDPLVCENINTPDDYKRVYGLNLE